MKKRFIFALSISIFMMFAGNAFAGWEEGATIEQVKQTATGVYARVALSSGAKVFALVAPTLENHILAIFLTAQASNYTVDVNLATGPKIIGAALNTQ